MPVVFTTSVSEPLLGSSTNFEDSIEPDSLNSFEDLTLPASSSSFEDLKLPLSIINNEDLNVPDDFSSHKNLSLLATSNNNKGFSLCDNLHHKDVNVPDNVNLDKETDSISHTDKQKIITIEIINDTHHQFNTPDEKTFNLSAIQNASSSSNLSSDQSQVFNDCAMDMSKAKNIKDESDYFPEVHCDSNINESPTAAKVLAIGLSPSKQIDDCIISEFMYDSVVTDPSQNNTMEVESHSKGELIIILNISLTCNKNVLYI